MAVDTAVVPHAPEPAAVREWLLASGHPLSGDDPELASDDLDVLSPAVAGARVVGLGEATHGTREFFRLKHRLIRWLVTSHGVTLVGLEANFADSIALDDYVTGGRGEPAVALAGTRFWVWNTEEVVALLRWMRAWNRQHGPILRVAGFDLQFPSTGLRIALNALTSVDHAEGAHARAALELLIDDHGAVVEPALPESQRAALRAAAGSLVDAIDERRQALIDRHGRQPWATARLAAVSVTQALAMSRVPERMRPIRDRAMADNACFLIDEWMPGARMALWAHNGHVGRQPAGSDWTPQGQHLADALGDDYRVIGFSFTGGTVRAVRHGGQLGTHRVPDPPAATVDAVLGAAPHPITAVLTAGIPQRGEIGRWVDSIPAGRVIGAGLDDDPAAHLVDQHLRQAYDVLIHLRETTASRATPTATRGPSRSTEPVESPHPLDVGDLDGRNLPHGWSVSPGQGLGYEAAVADGALVVERHQPAFAWGMCEVWQTTLLQVSPVRLRVRALLDINLESDCSAVHLRAVARSEQGAALAIATARVQGGTVVEDRRRAELTVDCPPNTHTVTAVVSLCGDGRLGIRALEIAE